MISHVYTALLQSWLHEKLFFRMYIQIAKQSYHLRTYVRMYVHLNSGA